MRLHDIELQLEDPGRVLVLVRPLEPDRHGDALEFLQIANGQTIDLRPGLDELKWLKPVYPGETLAARYTVLSKRVSAKRPETGIVTMHWQVFSTAGEMKMEVTGVNLIRVRSP